MQAQWANGLAYHRCRFPAEYALANKIAHPRNVFVRESDVLPELDAWLAEQLAPHRVETAIEEMASALDGCGHQQAIAEAYQAIRQRQAKMIRYRVALDAGGDVEETTKWINAAKAERIQAEAVIRATTAPPA